MTLISVYNSDGCVGRCDAKCYNAECKECDCICGGVNHGVGRSKAESNTRIYSEKWLEKYIDEKKIENAKGEVNQEIFQLKLF